MRDATKEERQSINNYIKNNSIKTGVNFNEILDGKKEDKRVFIVKDKFDETKGIFESESEANQLAAYLNSKFLKAQKDFKNNVHTQKYSVKSYPVGEFRRRKKLFWLITLYFDYHPTGVYNNLLDGCPYIVANIEKTMVIDYEIDDVINMEAGEITNHIYFTTPFKTTTNDLKSIAYEKLHEKWKAGLLIESKVKEQ